MLAPRVKGRPGPEVAWRPLGDERLSEPLSVAVVGGGIAGLSAATILAERGASVTLIEREGELGGRARGWTDQLSDGTSFEMERGFHAFFRQYYNLRRLLRRVDPGLVRLRPLDDYPLLGPNGAVESFSGLPSQTPLNLLSLVWRSPSLSMFDAMRMRPEFSLAMLSYHPARTFERWDEVSAQSFLDGLGLPPKARRMLFDVFAHSFFNPEAQLSAGELLAMFHFYFLGNPEGLVFDVADRPFGRAFWNPLGDYLRRLGVRIETKSSATRIDRGEDGRFVVERLEDGPVHADQVVLALEVPALKRLVAASDALDDSTWRQRISRLEVTSPFAVWRMWLDRPLRDDAPPFVGTTGVGCLDNISVYEKLEDESREWTRRTGGTVVELHGYAVPPELSGPQNEAALRQDLLDAFHTFYPEAAGAKVLDERFIVEQDCPSFAPGSYANRPEVVTPIEGLYLAGDVVRVPFPAALMERAASSGFIAGNEILASRRVRGEEILSVSNAGLLTR